jgi:putative amide transporter protein
MIGIMLIYVGAVLLVNGIAGLGGIDAKSSAVLNFMVGSLGTFFSLLNLVRADSTAEYFTVATFFLFTFTYLYVAISSWYELDMRGFGWYCFFVALTAIPTSMMAFKSGDLRFGGFWLIWGALWYTFYLSSAHGKDFGKALPYATIIVGVTTCWIPGMLILTEYW